MPSTICGGAPASCWSATHAGYLRDLPATRAFERRVEQRHVRQRSDGVVWRVMWRWRVACVFTQRCRPCGFSMFILLALCCLSCDASWAFPVLSLPTCLSPVSISNSYSGACVGTWMLFGWYQASWAAAFAHRHQQTSHISSPCAPDKRHRGWMDVCFHHRARIIAKRASRRFRQYQKLSRYNAQRARLRASRRLNAASSLIAHSAPLRVSPYNAPPHHQRQWHSGCASSRGMAGGSGDGAPRQGELVDEQHRACARIFRCIANGGMARHQRSAASADNKISAALASKNGVSKRSRHQQHGSMAA